MGCCLNPMAPPQAALDFASVQERDIGLRQTPLEKFMSTLRASSLADTFTRNYLQDLLHEGKWKDMICGHRFAFYILTHPSLLTSDQKVHKQSLVALGLLYAKASKNIKANIFLLEVQNQDILKEMAERMFYIAARVVPLYLEQKNKEVDKVASEDEINLVLQDFMEEALGPYKSYSYKLLSQFMTKQGAYILYPEKIREKFSMKYFNELVGTRDQDDSAPISIDDAKSDQKSEKDKDAKSEKAEDAKSEKAEDAKSEKAESEGQPEQVKESDESDDDDDEDLDCEKDDTGVVIFDIEILKKQKIQRSRAAFNAFIKHQFESDKCGDITHTLGFLHLEKLVRLAKYAWKRSHHYWQPLGTILFKHIAFLEKEEDMENLHKFFARHYKSDELKQIFAEAKKSGNYEEYINWLKAKFEDVEIPKEKNSLALIIMKVLNNCAGNLRNGCSQTNRNVIRKLVDLPYEDGEIGGIKFIQFFIECCAQLKNLIPQASDYIRKNIVQRVLSPAISEDGLHVISSKECPYEQGHQKELRSEYLIPAEKFKDLVKKVEEIYGEELQIQGIEGLKTEEEEKLEEDQKDEEKQEESSEKEETQEKAETQEKVESEEEVEEKDAIEEKEESDKEDEEGSEKEEDKEEVGPIELEEELKVPGEFVFKIETLKSLKIPRSKCAFNAYIEHQFDQVTCCDITHSIGFSYLEKLVRLAKYFWRESTDLWKGMGQLVSKHIELIAKGPDTEDRMANLHNFLDNYIKGDEFQEVFDKAKEEGEYAEYTELVLNQFEKVREADEIDEVSLIVIKALNNYAGNLRSACSETNRNVIRKHVDLPFNGEQIQGIPFVEYFVDCCAKLKELIPQSAQYIKSNILENALNGVVSEDGASIISSKWCDLEQGHDKELKSQNFIPGQLYRDLIKKAEEMYGETLELKALKELKEVEDE